MSVPKGLALPPHCGAAVTAEEAGDLVSAVGLDGVGLGGALCHLEVFRTRNDDVWGVGATSLVLAVGAVAQGLEDGLDTKHDNMILQLKQLVATHLGCGLTLERVADLTTEASSGRHCDM